jgi:hypothetical protein
MWGVIQKNTKIPSEMRTGASAVSTVCQGSFSLILKSDVADEFFYPVINR